MVLADERILEYMRENESGAPTEMAESGDVRYTPQHISQRCKKLAENDLLQPLGNGVYILTEAGESYLNEQYDAEACRYIDQDQTSGPDTTTGAESETENAG